MADVLRCPTCGKLNPSDLETCAFCGASLKPSQPPAQPDADVPDWLRDLRSDEPSGQPDSGFPAEGSGSPDQVSGSGADVPDWLTRIRERNQSETSSPVDLPGETAGEADWMKGLQDETPSDQPGEDDWLSRLGQESSPSTGEAQAPAPSEPAGLDVPDWLGALADETPKTEPPGSTPRGETAQPAQDDFSWLQNADSPIGETAAEPGSPDSWGGDLNSFLSKLENSPEGGENNVGGMGNAVNDSGLPLDVSQILSEPAAPGSAAPFGDLGEGGLEWMSPEEKSDQPAADGGLDLSGFLTSNGDTESLPPLTPGDFSADNFSDWQQLSQNETSGQSAETPEPKNDATLPDAGQPENASEPDWLSSFMSNDSPTPAANDTNDANQPAGFPDWLNNTPSAQDEPVQQSPESEFPSQAGDAAENPLAGLAGLPGWFDSQENPEPEPPAASEPPVFGDASSELPVAPHASAPAEDQTPDWLRELNEAPSASAESQVPPLIGGEEALASPTADSGQPFDVELPDWLNEDQSAEEAGKPESAAESASAAEIAKAELPEWVQEMRPIESIIPDQNVTPEVDQRVEKAGPLAGMPGILPAEELVTRYRKPPVYSMKLRVTEKQRSQSALFDSILAEEMQPLQLPKQHKQAQGMLLRVALTLILIAVLAIPLIPGFGFDALVIPALYPSDMQSMFNQINQSLAPETPVLLAVDYEPGLSGEMSLAASALISQLEAKNARVIVVSTIPTGPALAYQLLNNAQQANAKYNIAQRTVDLGYLPGGTTSLLAFARQPQMVAPGWSSTYLKDLPGLQGFGQIILLTDRAETGRAWVEQVQPSVGKVPFFIVASAQAAPLLEPYVGSGQVTGMVRGVLGGAMYAQLAGQKNGAATGYLSAYQLGVGLGFVLLLFGGVISGGAALLKRNPKDEE